ncbi:MAG: flagellar hook protein FlgE [Myxococcota bacterium]|jgi:flagellar hook protein FlgE|nr:flagellar hook protein FlgE [Myxococcota bacterium]
MSLFGTLGIGVTAINANGKAIQVASENISNVNTVGFKRSRVSFGDIVADTSDTHGLLAAIGFGTKLVDIQRMHSQGAIMNTSFPLDMAIAGEGFFVLNGEQVGRPGQTLFSRAGQFRVDKDGFVVNPSGARLQGQPVGANDELQSTTADLAVQRTNIAPRQTTEIALALNLDARTAVRGGLGGPLPFDVNDPDATSDYATTVSVFDSLGKPYDARLYFERTSNTTWDAHILIDGVEVQTQQFTFQQNGALVSNVTTQAGNWNPTPPAAQGVAFNFDAGTTFDAVTGTGGLDGITSFGSASTIVTQSQDGYASGSLVSIDLARDGMLRGNYTNGKSLVLGQVTLAQFRNPEGLNRIGENLFEGSLESGDEAIAAPLTGSRGSIIQGSLEASNVDLAQEFVDLIQYQRAFQAGSRSVTTGDELLREVVNLKR